MARMSRGSSQGLVRTERRTPNGTAAPTTHAASTPSTRRLARTPATTATTSNEPASPATPERTARSVSTAATPGQEHPAVGRSGHGQTQGAGRGLHGVHWPTL